MIPSNAVFVSSASELRTAVSSNNGVEYVVMTQNITLDGGITIYAGKQTLVIDGEYPTGSGTYHQFTDIDVLLSDYALGIRSTSSIDLTLRNMTIHGYNYYGVPYVAPNGIGLNTSDVTVTYENVTYNGPQITYHRYGTTRYIDCTITIERTGSSAAEEVGEVNHVEIGGRTTIRHTSTTSGTSTPAVFWFLDENTTSTFTILENADVEITTVNNYFMYNLHGAFGTTLVPIDYVVEAGATFRLTANRAISNGSAHLVNSFRLAENALFHYVQTGNNGANASLYMNGALTVGPTSRFIMESESATQPLLYFANNAAHNLVLIDPLSFVLYNANAAAMNTAAQMPFSFQADQVNRWATATTPRSEAGGFTDTPQHKWNKRSFQGLVEISGTFTNAATTIGSHNLTADDDGFAELNQLLLGTARVLSVGDIRELINPVVNDGRAITGVTEPGANIRIEYEAPEGSFHTLTGTAGDNGRFTIETTEEDPSEVPIGTQLAFWFNTPFIIKRVDTIAIDVGSFELVRAPDHIAFNTPSIINDFGVFLQRYYPNDDEEITVTDSRVDSTAWQLLLSVHMDLTTEDGDSLPRALVYQTSDPLAEPVVLGAEPIVVYTGEPNEGETKTVDITWPYNEGVLARIDRPIRSGVQYSSRLFWDLRIIENVIFQEGDEGE